MKQYKPVKPLRRYKNLADVKHHFISPNFVGEWPCPNCRGKGKVRDPNDCDPVEGYKLAGWHKCTYCNGSGETTKDVIKGIYQEELAVYRAAMKVYHEDMKIFRSILDKLSNDEIKFLEKHATRGYHA